MAAEFVDVVAEVVEVVGEIVGMVVVVMVEQEVQQLGLMHEGCI